MTRRGSCLPILVAFTIATSLRLLPVSSCFALPQRLGRERSAAHLHSLELKSIVKHPHQQRQRQRRQHQLLAQVRGGETTTALQSSSSSSETTETAPPPPPQPTLRDLVKFALPCLGLWISGPLLSLIDTASVGLTAKPGIGVTELGALGPTTTFLNVATTNLYASALAKNSNDEEASRLAGDAVVRTAIKISLICGIAIMTLLFTKGQSLLHLYVGEKASAQILGPATEYVHIRALSLPTSLLAGSSLKSLLCNEDQDGNCIYQNTVTLSTNYACTGIECDVDTVRVVQKVGTGVGLSDKVKKMEIFVEPCRDYRDKIRQYNRMS